MRGTCGFTDTQCATADSTKPYASLATCNKGVCAEADCCTDTAGMTGEFESDTVVKKSNPGERGK